MYYDLDEDLHKWIANVHNKLPAPAEAENTMAVKQEDTSTTPPSGDIFESFRESPGDPSPARKILSVEEEFTAYLGADLVDKYTTTTNPLPFWDSQKQNFPKLASVAKSVFVIPATSAQVRILFTGF